MTSPAAQRGGRPSKPDLERRSVPICPRFTVLEAATIRHQAAAAEISPTEYVYRSAVGREIIAAPRRRVDPALISTLNKLACEVSALGNVTNQVARYHHTDQAHRVPGEWADLPQVIRENQRAIAALIEGLVGGDGS